MQPGRLPSRDEMLQAFASRDGEYEGVFVTAVRTTGVFCRPSCPARKPKPENVEFFASAQQALLAGYRACARCRPLERRGEAPAWLRPLLAEVEADPGRRWRDRDLRDRDLSPERVRRWFQRELGMTFHAFSRARRIGNAVGRISQGDRVTPAAMASGYEALSGFNDAFKALIGEPPSRVTGGETLHATRIPTPLGPLMAIADERSLHLLEFVDRPMLPTQLARLHKLTKAACLPGSSPVFEQIRAELDAYFAGRLRTFATPLAWLGTDFQKRVWRGLTEIPYGSTTSYGQLARDLGRPTAARAVAHANGDNRLAIVIPCHRVVGADGKLTGYGGGLWRKQRLLEIEA